MNADQKNWPVESAGLYPSILFHFTDRGGLFGILSSNFKIRYSIERIVGKTLSKEFGAPMVSFCDLRLSELKSHMRSYGWYGIGMSKEWAIENGLNPVYYLSTNADLTDAYLGGVDGLFEHINKIKDADEHTAMSSIYMDFFNACRYMKNYEGELRRRDGTTHPSYRFANEREWRYVPSLSANFHPFIGKAELDDPGTKQKLNQQFDNTPLYFEPKDIRYIIVQHEKERDEIIQHILAVKGKYGDADAQRLASRILTAEQIFVDI